MRFVAEYERMEKSCAHFRPIVKVNILHTVAATHIKHLPSDPVRLPGSKENDR